VTPIDGADPVQLTKSADIALYCAKADGRGCYRFYEREMGELTQARYSLERDLRKALLENEFTLFYQPLINLRPRRGQRLRSPVAMAQPGARTGPAGFLHSPGRGDRF